MSAAPIDEPAVNAAARKGLEQCVGSSMTRGSRLEIWCKREKVGVFECLGLTATCLEFRAEGRFLGRSFDVRGKLELDARGHCAIELGQLRDPDARYCLQHRRPIVISEGLDGYEPSLRFWPERAETRAELRCNVDRVRAKFDLTIGARRDVRR
jgi:hypothetical protein